MFPIPSVESSSCSSCPSINFFSFFGEKNSGFIAHFCFVIFVVFFIYLFFLFEFFFFSIFSTFYDQYLIATSNFMYQKRFLKIFLDILTKKISWSKFLSPSMEVSNIFLELIFYPFNKIFLLHGNFPTDVLFSHLYTSIQSGTEFRYLNFYTLQDKTPNRCPVSRFYTL